MIAKKIEQLLHAAKAYYVDNAPIISDKEYDELFREVKSWEELNHIKDPITSKVCLGYFEGDQTQKVKHIYPMLSIENNNVKVIDKEVIITPKIDGVACELIYYRGLLYQKLTRGDGEYGSDITKVKIHSIPAKIQAKEACIVIRGEIHCPTFTEYGKSHRNVVAGSVSRVDFTEDRQLYFVPYWTSLHEILVTFEQELQWLKEQGFSAIPYIKTKTPIDFTSDLIPDLPYPIDGYVIRYNDNSFYGEYTSHHYKGIWCWKCPEEAKETIIEGVEWSKSLNATLTPVALVRPVDFADSTVSRVSLHNLDYIETRDIAIGDTVLIHKAKGIIPEIKKVLHRPADREDIFILYCPDCGSLLTKEGPYLKCTSFTCCVNEFVAFFAKTMDIKGLAQKSVEKLKLKHPLDLYSLSKEELIQRLGKNGAKVYNEIQKSKSMPVTKLLSALNVPNAKEATLQKIFNEYPNLEVLGNQSTLESIKGIGPVKALSISTWYKDKFEPLIPILNQIGFDLIPKTQTGLIIAVSGTFPITRKDFTVMMEAKGITVANLTKKTQIFVTGDKPSQSKINKAIKYNIPVVPYLQFLKDLKEVNEQKICN